MAWDKPLVVLNQEHTWDLVVQETPIETFKALLIYMQGLTINLRNIINLFFDPSNWRN